MRDPELTTVPRARPGDGLDPRPPARDRVERVVLAIDFAPASLGAARWAVAHLASRGASGRPTLDACVAHVVPWPGDTLEPREAGDAREPRGPGAAALRGLRPALVGGLAGVAASLGLAGARPVVRVGRPSTLLGELAEAEGAGLVVLGRRRDSARSRIGEPNVIERLARRARCDVLVVPEGAPGPVEHVIAAVDAGPGAGRVVARALAIARAHRAALTLAHVLSPFHGSYERLVRSRQRAPGAHEVEAARDVVAHQDAAYASLASLMRDADPAVTCQLSVPIGDAARELDELATGRGPALVVVGKRGADGAPAGSLGSVARELALRGHAPVLALECGGTEDDDR